MQTAVENQLARRGCSGQLLDRAVDIRHGRVGHAARKLEPALRKTRLPPCRDPADCERSGNERTGRERHTPPHGKFAEPVCKSRLARAERPFIEEAFYVVRKLLDRRIAPLRIVLRCLRNDRIEFLTAASRYSIRR